MVSEERKRYLARYYVEYRARKHDGVVWPKGRPRKVKLERELKCIYCTQLLMDEYHIKFPCWKSKMYTIFADKTDDGLELW